MQVARTSYAEAVRHAGVAAMNELVFEDESMLEIPWSQLPVVVCSCLPLSSKANYGTPAASTRRPEERVYTPA